MDKRKVLSADLQHLRFKQFVSKTSVRTRSKLLSQNGMIKSNFYLGLIICSSPLFLIIHPITIRVYASNVSYLRFKQSDFQNYQKFAGPQFIPLLNYNYFPPVGPPKLNNFFSFSPSLLCTGSPFISLTDPRLIPEDFWAERLTET